MKVFSITFHINKFSNNKLLLSLICGLICTKSYCQSSSKEEIRKYQSIASTPGISNEELTIAIENISSNFQGINQDSAIFYCNKAIELAIAGNNYKELANCYVLQGINYTWNSDFEPASAYLRKADSTATKNNYPDILTAAWDMTSYMYQQSEVWDEAWIYANKILDLAEETNDKNPINRIDAYSDFAAVYAGLGYNKRAIDYFEKSVKGYSDTNYSYNRGSVFIEYSKLLISTKAFTKAKYFLDSALKLFMIFEEPIQIADVYEKYGMYYYDQAKYDSAELFFLKSFNIYAENELRVDKEKIAISLAKIAYIKKDFKGCRNLINESYNFFKFRKEYSIRLNTIELLLKLNEIEQHKGDFEKYMSEYLEVSNLIKLRNSDLRTRQLITEYDLEQQTKENLKLKSENKIQQEKLTILIVAGIIFIIILIFLYIQYQQKNKALAEVKKMQISTQEKNSELSRLLMVKNKLISMIAHDIRAPLASLQNTISLTHDKILDKKEFDHLTRILLGETNHLRSMLDNMLLWVRQQIIDIQINKTHFNLNDFFRNILELYQSNITQKNLCIHNNINPEKIIYSDQDILHTVFRNIISNAVKFTPDGKAIYIDCIEEANNMLYITVSDEGTGIPNEIFDKIQKNEFVSTRGTANEKGTGIGILFSKDLIGKLGETLTINTIAGKGTIVTISVSNIVI